MRTRFAILQKRVFRNAESVQNRGHVVVRSDRVQGRISRMRIAGPIHRSAPDAAARQQTGVAARPVFASGVALRNLRPATELTNPRDDRFLQQTAVAQIIQQRAQRTIRRWNQVILQAVEVVAVSVPEVLAVVVPVHRDQRNTAFHQSPGQEHALTMNVPAIAIPHRIGFG